MTTGERRGSRSLRGGAVVAERPLRVAVVEDYGPMRALLVRELVAGGFRAVGYPYLTGLALGLASVCLVSLFYYNPGIGLVFLGLVGLGLLYYAARGRHRIEANWAD